MRLKNYINQEIIGQDVLVERMLIGLLADGHILVEGAPGLPRPSDQRFKQRHTRRFSSGAVHARFVTGGFNRH